MTQQKQYGTRPLAALGAAALASVAILWLPGCGASNNAPPVSPAIAAKADVTIGFDGVDQNCIVALPTEPQGSTIPCTDLIRFLRDELRLPSGSIYDTHMAAKVDAAEVAKTTQSLKDAGYRFIGGH